jgi:1-acyl-sn-glycerol-3-phosphate acyltransferase
MTKSSTQPEVPSTWSAMVAQLILGAGCKVLFCLPYLRKIHGLRELPHKRYLYVCNHVSLLDTILLGGIFWWSRRLPIFVLGDRGVWKENWIRRALSAKLGYLLDRGRVSKDVMRQLRTFGKASERFSLIVFPEGTRGDGQTVLECRPGAHVIARAAGVPIVPIFIENMQLVSSKTEPYTPMRGLRKIHVHFGRSWEPEDYRGLSTDDFCREVRARLQELAPST